MFKKLLNWFLDWVFPRICLGCGTVEGVLLCRKCLSSLARTPAQRCHVCKTPQPSGAPCASCRQKTALDYVFVATHDSKRIVRKLIHFFKYRFVSELASPLSGLMLSAFTKQILTTEDLVLVPVPLHPQRERWRGFNQSFVLAQAIGNIADLEIASHALRRIRKTHPQATLSRENRLRNLHKAFSCTAIPPHKEIMLIDDVATTGTTLEECARLLKKNGAHRVGALVISRGT